MLLASFLGQHLGDFSDYRFVYVFDGFPVCPAGRYDHRRTESDREARKELAVAEDFVCAGYDGGYDRYAGFDGNHAQTASARPSSPVLLGCLRENANNFAAFKQRQGGADGCAVGQAAADGEAPRA
jgi:hypothetical protein